MSEYLSTRPIQACFDSFGSQSLHHFPNGWRDRVPDTKNPNNFICSCPSSLTWRSESRSPTLHQLDWADLSLDKRKVITRRPHRTVGRIPVDWLADVPLEHESGLEANFIKQAILVPGIKKISSQPETFVFAESIAKTLERKSYTPDFSITFDDGHLLLVEVRHSARVEKDREFFEQFGPLLNSVGVSYSVITDLCIEQPLVRIQNAGLVYRYSRVDFYMPNQLGVFGQQFRFSELLEYFEGDRQQTFWAIARMNFDWNINQQISGDALFTISSRGVGDECFHAKNWFGI